MKQYHDLLQHILDNGTDKSDRTGTGTRSVFGYQMRFDLAEGFPLLTTKKVHLKSVIHELIWFLKGDTNTKYLEDNGVTIWKEWSRPYSLNRDIVFIEPLQQSYTSYNGDFSYAGLNASSGSIENKLADTWLRMMRRCYDPSCHNYRFYGEQGASVSSNWHDPATFIREVQTIPHWSYKKDNWNRFELDKDYYGSNKYSLDTCVWLDTAENNIYTKSAKPLQITNSNGLSSFYITLSEASRQIGIPNSTLSRFLHGMPTILKGNNKKYIGWSFEEADLNGKLPRLRLIKNGDLGAIYGQQWRSWSDAYGTTIDQIAEVIKTLKTNPDSRRMVISAWNVADLPDMALAPCHCLFQFYVVNGKLSCQLYVRSNDVFLGAPFNIASYALLTMMIAQVCDMVPGELIYTIGDAHLYNNHIEQAKLQLTRNPRQLPTMKLNPNVKDIDDFKYEDFTLEGYDPYPAIKAPVAV